MRPSFSGYANALRDKISTARKHRYTPPLLFLYRGIVCALCKMSGRSDSDSEGERPRPEGGEQSPPESPLSVAGWLAFPSSIMLAQTTTARY